MKRTLSFERLLKSSFDDGFRCGMESMINLVIKDHTKMIKVYENMLNIIKRKQKGK